MAREFAKEIVTREVTVVTSISCDLCKKVGRLSDQSFGEFDGDVAECEVSCTTGEQGYDYGDKVIVRYDVCPDCFRSKIVPLFEACGVSPRVEKVSY